MDYASLKNPAVTARNIKKMHEIADLVPIYYCDYSLYDKINVNPQIACGGILLVSISKNSKLEGCIHEKEKFKNLVCTQIANIAMNLYKIAKCNDMSESIGFKVFFLVYSMREILEMEFTIKDAKIILSGDVISNTLQKTNWLDLNFDYRFNYYFRDNELVHKNNRTTFSQENYILIRILRSTIERRKSLYFG
jgi:hypothetical protein